MKTPRKGFGIDRRTFFQKMIGGAAAVATGPNLLLERFATAGETPPVFNPFELREEIFRLAGQRQMLPLSDKQINLQFAAPKESPAGKLWVFQNGGFTPHLPAANAAEIQKKNSADGDSGRNKWFFAKNEITSSTPGNNPFAQLETGNLANGDIFHVSSVTGKLVAQRIGFAPAMTATSGKIGQVCSGGILSAQSNCFPSVWEFSQSLSEQTAESPEQILKWIAAGQFDKIEQIIARDGPQTNLLAGLADCAFGSFDPDPNRPNFKTPVSQFATNSATIEYFLSGFSSPLPPGVEPTIFNLGEPFFAAMNSLPLADRLRIMVHSMGAGNGIFSTVELLKEIQNEKIALSKLREQCSSNEAQALQALEGAIQKNAKRQVELVLVNPACFPMDNLVFPFNLLTKGPVSQVIAAAAPAIKMALIEFSLETVFADKANVTPEIVDHFYRLIFENGNFLSNQVAMISEAFNPESPGSWAQIEKYLQGEAIPEIACGILNDRARILILAGEIDELVPAHLQHRLWQEIQAECERQIKLLDADKQSAARQNLTTNLVFNIMLGQSHMIPQETKPQTFAQVIEEFHNKKLRTGVLAPLEQFQNTNGKVLGDHFQVESNNPESLKKFCRGKGFTSWGAFFNSMNLGARVAKYSPHSVADGGRWTFSTVGGFLNAIRTAAR